MNNTPETNASSSFVFLRFFIFVLPLFTAPIADSPAFGVMGASGANIYQGGVIIMGLRPLHIELLPIRRLPACSSTYRVGHATERTSINIPTRYALGIMNKDSSCERLSYRKTLNML